MFNQVILIGNLTKKPELRNTPSGKEVASADLATNKKFKNQAGELVEQVQFHRLVIWNNASAFYQYLDKGSKVFIKGELQTRSYDKKDGTKAYITEVNVNEFKFLDSIQKEKEENRNNNKAEKIIDNFGGEIIEESEKEIKTENIPF
jgi:single-strand DNA-binding protein